MVYVNSPKKEHFEHKKGDAEKENYIGTILAYSYSINYTSSNVLTCINESHFCWKSIFKEEY